MKLKQNEFKDWHPWRWAQSALDEFRQKVAHQGWKPRNKELTIALVGKAQEGKTSVALRMMGVDQAWLSKIEKACRGGRESGNSATPAVTLYEMTEEAPSDELLKRIEALVKAARLNPPEILRIQIPAARGCLARIVDLVGVEASNWEEDARARQLTIDWLYQADLHAFVSGMDHIADLVKSHKPSLARILHYWQVNRETSVIVFTKAFEVDSAKEELSGFRDPVLLLDAAKMRCKRILVEELIRSYKIEYTSEQLPLTIPVSYGEKITPLAARSTELAMKEIEKLAEQDPLRFRVKAGFSLPRFLLRERQDAEEALSNYSKAQDTERKCRQRKLESIKGIKSVNQGNLLLISEDLESIVDVLMIFDIDHYDELVDKYYTEIEHYRHGNIRPSVSECCENWGDFSEAAEKYVNFIKRSLKDSIGSISRDIESKAPAFSKVIIPEIGRVMRGRINDIQNKIPDLERRKWLFNVRFDKDNTRKTVLQWTRSSRDSIVRLYRDELEGEFSEECKRMGDEYVKRKRQLEIHIKNIKGQLSENEIELDNSQKDFEDWEKETERTIGDLISKVELARRCEEEGRKYSSILASQYVAEWSRVVNIINSVDDAESAVFGLFCLTELSETLRQVKSMAKGEEDVESKRGQRPAAAK